MLKFNCKITSEMFTSDRKFENEHVNAQIKKNSKMKKLKS